MLMNKHNPRYALSYNNILLFSAVAVCVVAFGFMVALVVYSVLKLHNKPPIIEPTAERTYVGQSTRGIPLEMEFSAQTGLHTATTPPETSQPAPPERSPSMKGPSGPFPHPLERAENPIHNEVDSHPLRSNYNEPFCSNRSRSFRVHRRPYPEALHHDPVMTYYIHQSTDPHISNIGNEYHKNILSLIELNDHDKGSRESSEMHYGHARYLSSSVTSNIASDEIVFYRGSVMQCDRNLYDLNDKSDSIV